MLRITKPDKLQPSTIYGFDVETNEDGSFAFAFLVDSTGKKVQYWTNKFEAIKFFSQRKSEKTFITGMNIAYDLNTLFPEWNPKRIINGSKLITIAYEDEYHSRATHCIFVDIGNYIQQKSLKQIAGDYGFEYLDIHDVKHPHIKEACYSHAFSSAKILREIQKISHSWNCEIRITAPSLAMRIFKTNFLRHEDEIWDNRTSHSKEEIEEMKKISGHTYSGGVVEVFKKGKRKVTMIDVVSMYPFCMLNPLPDMNSWIIFSTKEHIQDFEEKKLIFSKEGMAFIEMTIPEMNIPPFIFQFFHGKKVSKCGYFVGWLNFVDIRYLLSMGIEIKYNRVYVFGRKNDFFKKYIETFFQLKKTKETKQFSKLMLNSLYGKFGQKSITDIEYREIDQGEVIDIERMEDDQGKVFQYKDKQFVREEKKDILFPSHSYPLISSYITSYARVYLHETMMKIGEEKIVYCDTDSIAFEGTIQDAAVSGVKIGKECGNFEEKWHGMIEAIRPKMYRYKPENQTYWEYVIKGIPKRIMEEFWNNNYQAYFSRPRKYFTAIRSGQKINEWICNKYEANPSINKRIFHKNGTSSPYNDNDKPYIS